MNPAGKKPGIFLDRVFIKTTIAKRRLTVRKVAKKCNIHYQHLCGVLRGDRPTSVFSAGKIAKALGVSVVDLFESNGK